MKPMTPYRIVDPSERMSLSALGEPVDTLTFGTDRVHEVDNPGCPGCLGPYPLTCPSCGQGYRHAGLTGGVSFTRCDHCGEHREPADGIPRG